MHTFTHTHSHIHSSSNPFPDVFLCRIYHSLMYMFSLFTVYLLSAPEHKVPEDKDSYSFLYFRGMNSAWHIVSTQTAVDVLTGGQQGLQPYCLQTMNHKENTPTAKTKREWLTRHSLCPGWLHQGARVEGAKEDTISPPRGPGQVTVLSLLLIYRMRGLNKVSAILFPTLKLYLYLPPGKDFPTKGSLGQ